MSHGFASVCSLPLSPCLPPCLPAAPPSLLPGMLLLVSLMRPLSAIILSLVFRSLLEHYIYTLSHVTISHTAPCFLTRAGKFSAKATRNAHVNRVILNHASRCYFCFLFQVTSAGNLQLFVICLSFLAAIGSWSCKREQLSP